MPRGPRGERRPADVVGCAVMVCRIATGEIEEVLSAKHPGALPAKHPGAVAMGRSGGKARARNLTPERRSEIARAAALKRWTQRTDDDWRQLMADLVGAQEGTLFLSGVVASFLHRPIDRFTTSTDLAMGLIPKDFALLKLSEDLAEFSRKAGMIWWAELKPRVFTGPIWDHVELWRGPSCGWTAPLAICRAAVRVHWALSKVDR